MANNGKRAHKPMTFHAREKLTFVTFEGKEFGRYFLGGRFKYFERRSGNNASNINRDIAIDNRDLQQIIDRKIAAQSINRMRAS